MFTDGRTDGRTDEGLVTISSEPFDRGEKWESFPQVCKHSEFAYIHKKNELICMMNLFSCFFNITAVACRKVTFLHATAVIL